MSDNRFFEARIRDIAIESTSLKAPAGAWERIATRVNDGDVVVLPLEHDAATPASRMWAASLIMFLLAGAAAAATIPGSPLREWLIGAQHLDRGVAPIPGAPDKEPAPPMESTTLIVAPVDGLVTVAFLNPGAAARVVIRLTNDVEVAVRAAGTAANASFRSGDGRLTIAQLDAGDLEVSIPRSLARMRVEVDGRVYLTKQNGQIRVLAPGADTIGSEFVIPIGKN